MSAETFPNFLIVLSKLLFDLTWHSFPVTKQYSTSSQSPANHQSIEFISLMRLPDVGLYKFPMTMAIKKRDNDRFAGEPTRPSTISSAKAGIPVGWLMLMITPFWRVVRNSKLRLRSEAIRYLSATKTYPVMSTFMGGVCRFKPTWKKCISLLLKTTRNVHEYVEIHWNPQNLKALNLFLVMYLFPVNFTHRKITGLHFLAARQVTCYCCYKYKVEDRQKNS